MVAPIFESALEAPVSERNWQFVPHDPEVIQALQTQHKLSPILAQLMAARGIHRFEEVKQFLEFKLSDLQEPECLPGAVEAAGIIWEAIQGKKRIWIYGDYDADGMTSTAILCQCIHLLGGSVRYHMPNRLEEGYGLNIESLDQLARKGCDLLVTVDCGIASIAAAQHAASLNIPLIISDHHTMSAELPQAAAIVHPALPGCHPGLSNLCGAGVAFKIAWALAQAANETGDDGPRKVAPHMRKFLLRALGWAALGTVADVVPLVGENRVLVRFGLNSLKADPGVGLNALMCLTKLNEKSQLKSEDIGFTIAPRLNAAGRLGQAQLAVELLVTQDKQRAEALAEYIHQLNVSRDSLDRKIYNNAVKRLKDDYDPEHDPGIVLADHDWHVGVIGIAAGRIAEKYNLPTVLISLDPTGNKPGTGSCRSACGINLYEALQSCSDYLEGFGGHREAAGLQILEQNVEPFRQAFWDYVSTNLCEEDRLPELSIDAEASLHQLTLETLAHIDQMAPFGQGNPVPTICSTECELIEPKTMGGGDRHFAVQVKQFGHTMRAVAFGKAEWVEQLVSVSGPVDIAYKPVVNEFRGYRKVELQLVDWRVSQVPSASVR